MLSEKSETVLISIIDVWEYHFYKSVTTIRYEVYRQYFPA